MKTPSDLGFNDHRDRFRGLTCSPAFQPGRSDVATVLVLAAPGREEEIDNRPAAGRTGENLDIILARANVALPRHFPSADRRDYCIVNAVSNVLYGSRTLPLVREIREPQNLARLRHQISNCSVIAGFGPHAIRAISEAGFQPTFCTGHPGLKGINQLPAEGASSSLAPTVARLNVLAKILIESERRCTNCMEKLVKLRASEKKRRIDEKERRLTAP